MSVIYVTGENAERVIKNISACNKATPKYDQYRGYIHYNTVIKSILAQEYVDEIIDASINNQINIILYL